jgi:hypothetical protein
MRSLLIIALASGVTACVDADSADNENTLQIIGSPEQTFTSENLGSPGSEDPTANAQDCVYIQWCDEPPPGGNTRVVGRVRPACFSQCWNDAIINEFMRDARAVCGRTSLDDNLWLIHCF